MSLTFEKLTRPEGELCVSYGGGVNSVALLLALRAAGIVPRAITMADPGSEHTETVRYRDEVMGPWCKQAGFPAIDVLERRLVGIGRPRTWRLETLEEECLRTQSLPSVAYGWKKCSSKYKMEPQRWWTEKQSWALEAWAADRKVVRAIGYDLDEERRVKKSQTVDWKTDLEAKRYGSWYPLFELGLDRAGCEQWILSHGMPLPPKSACTFCPNNTFEEWQDLRRDEPEAFARAVEMSRRAAPTITSEATGLMRCNPHGQRALHVWADGGYPDLPLTAPDEDDDSMPCECAT